MTNLSLLRFVHMLDGSTLSILNLTVEELEQEVEEGTVRIDGHPNHRKCHITGRGRDILKEAKLDKYGGDERSQHPDADFERYVKRANLSNQFTPRRDSQ